MYLTQAILFILFLVNVGIGMRYIFRAITLQQYAVGSKYSTIAESVHAILMVSYGFWLFCEALNITFIIFFNALAIRYLIISKLFSSRLHLFFTSYSVAEIMGKLYGQHIRSIVALASLIQSIVLTGTSINVLKIVISRFYAIKPEYSLCIACFFVIFNAESRGAKPSVVWSTIRYTTFSLLLPMIALFLWKKILNQCHNDQHLLALSIKEAWQELIYAPLCKSPIQHIMLFIFILMPALNPMQVQRMLIAENATQFKRAYNYIGYLLLSINLFIAWIALLLHKTYGNTPLSHIPLTLFDSYPSLKILCTIGIVTLISSYAGVNVHTATVLVINDLPRLFKRNAKKAVTHFSGYIVTLSLISMLVGQYSSVSAQTAIIIFYKVIIGIPLCIALMGIHLHPHAVLIGMVISTLSLIYVAFPSLTKANIDIVTLSIQPSIIHLLSLIIAHNFLKRRSNQSDYRQLNIAYHLGKTVPAKPFWSRIANYILQQIKQCNPDAYVQKTLPKDSLPYLLFSFYIVITGYGFFYTFAGNAIWSGRLESIVLFPSLFTATFFIAYVSVPSRPYLTRIASWIWPLSNGYFLFLVGSGILIFSKFACLPTIILMMHIYLSILITPLMVIVTSCITTFIVLWLLRTSIHGQIIGLDGFLNLNSRIIYIILMLYILLGSLCYHRKRLNKLAVTIKELRNGQETQNARQLFNKQHIEALAYESSYLITQLHQQFLRLGNLQDSDLVAPINRQATRLNAYFESIFAYLKNNLHLATNWISIDQLLEDSLDSITINDINHIPYVVINIESIYIQCDVERIKHLLINSFASCKLHQAQNSAIKKDIHIYVNNTQLGYRLTLLQGKIQRVNAVSFTITTKIQRPTILPVYKVIEMADLELFDGTEVRDKIDIENQHIINSHYGYYEFIHSDQDITYLYVIPINLQEITKAFATLSPVVYTQHIPLDAASINEETSFFQKVREKQGLDVQTMTDVLQLIKTYYTVQKRKTGEPAYLHPMAVASILLDVTDEADVIIAGLVHDVVANTPLTEAGLSTLVGEKITQIVRMVRYIDHNIPSNKNDYSAYIQRLLNNKYYNALLIKLANVLHNTQTIHGHSIEQQTEKEILIENFYIPLAKQMGLASIAHALHLHTAKGLHHTCT